MNIYSNFGYSQVGHLQKSQSIYLIAAYLPNWWIGWVWCYIDKTDEASLRMYNEAMIGFTNKIVHRKPLLNEKKEKSK
jgi:hypothetical protein